MSLQVPEHPYHFVVNTLAERNTGWHDGSTVWVKDTNQLFVLDNGAWVEITTEGGDTDEKVGVDSGATPGYLGASSSDGVLRADSTLDYTDGGDYVTLGLDSTLKSNYDTAYTHSQDNTQAHTDYLINNGDDTTSGTLTATGFTDGTALITGGNYTSSGTIAIGGNLYLDSDQELHFEGTGGDNYWKWNSSSGYMELYVEGALRVQF